MFFPPTSKRFSVARTDDVSSSSMSSSSYASRGNNNNNNNNDPNNNNHRGGGGDHNGDPNDPNNNSNAPVVTYAKEIIADHSCCSSISSISMETKGPRDFETTHS